MPEQSTVAIIAHHPQAVYFGMKSGFIPKEQGARRADRRHRARQRAAVGRRSAGLSLGLRSRPGCRRGGASTRRSRMHRRIVLFVSLLAALALAAPAARRPEPVPTSRRVWPRPRGHHRLRSGRRGRPARARLGALVQLHRRLRRPTTLAMPPSWARRTATTGFRDDMYAHCATRPWYQRGLCRSTANVYYDAVRRFGHLFY